MHTPMGYAFEHVADRFPHFHCPLLIYLLAQDRKCKVKIQIQVTMRQEQEILSNMLNIRWIVVDLNTVPCLLTLRIIYGLKD